MPLPTPRQDESRADFISRCMSNENIQQEFDSQSQRLGVCHSQWNQSQERDMSVNSKLLSSIKARAQKSTEFNYGILTADRYVKTLQDGVGLDVCNKYASTRHISFDDILTKAADTLVYGNPEMVVEKRISASDFDLPKDTLMAFSHVLTTSRKDRDGDILRSKGAEADPKMLLLWQHVPTLPIGKMVAVVKQTRNQLSVVSAIVDMNELSHDAAVMIDNDMGRFSHGFRALEFEEIEDEDDKDVFGFDVKRFEIMEESLVSVPANTDAETQEILLSLVEGGKITSPLMKEYGKTIRERRAIIVPGIKLKEETEDGSREFTCNSLADLKAAADAGLIGVSRDENVSRAGSKKSEEAAGEGRGSSTSKEDGKKSGEEKETTPDTQVEKYYSGELENSWEWTERQLRGRVRGYLTSIGISIGERDWVSIIGTFPDHVIACVEKPESGVEDEFRYFKMNWETKEGEPSFKGEPSRIDMVITTEIRNFSNSYSMKQQTKTDVEKAMSIVLSKATSEQRATMLDLLKAINGTESSNLVKQYRAIKGK